MFCKEICLVIIMGICDKSQRNIAMSVLQFASNESLHYLPLTIDGVSDTALGGHLLPGPPPFFLTEHQIHRKTSEQTTIHRNIKSIWDKKRFILARNCAWQDILSREVWFWWNHGLCSAGEAWDINVKNSLNIQVVSDGFFFSILRGWCVMLRGEKGTILF